MDNLSRRRHLPKKNTNITQNHLIFTEADVTNVILIFRIWWNYLILNFKQFTYLEIL